MFYMHMASEDEIFTQDGKQNIRHRYIFSCKEARKVNLPQKCLCESFLDLIVHNLPDL